MSVSRRAKTANQCPGIPRTTNQCNFLVQLFPFFIDLWTKMAWANNATVCDFRTQLFDTRYVHAKPRQWVYVIKQWTTKEAINIRENYLIWTICLKKKKSNIGLTIIICVNTLKHTSLKIIGDWFDVLWTLIFITWRCKPCAQQSTYRMYLLISTKHADPLLYLL